MIDIPWNAKNIKLIFHFENSNLVYFAFYSKREDVGDAVTLPDECKALYVKRIQIYYEEMDFDTNDDWSDLLNAIYGDEEDEFDDEDFTDRDE